MSRGMLKTGRGNWRHILEIEKLEKRLADSGWSEVAEQRSQQQLNDARP